MLVGDRVVKCETEGDRVVNCETDGESVLIGETESGRCIDCEIEGDIGDKDCKCDNNSGRDSK